MSLNQDSVSSVPSAIIYSLVSWIIKHNTKHKVTLKKNISKYIYICLLKRLKNLSPWKVIFTRHFVRKFSVLKQPSCIFLALLPLALRYNILNFRNQVIFQFNSIQFKFISVQNLTA
jgi:hypothetical protein